MIRLFLFAMALVGSLAVAMANEGGPQGGGPGASGPGDEHSWCPPGLGHPDCN
jgi:hypothetical protein